jgi:hypothetical protein
MGSDYIRNFLSMADAGSPGNKGTKDGVGMDQIIISGMGFEPVEK